MDASLLTVEGLAVARAEIAQRHVDGEGGEAICAARSALVDEVVAALFERTADASDAPLSVLAVGGYGRRELAPNSDVDLLFLTDAPADAEPRVQAMLRGLWDLGFQVGFATRGVAESVELAADDLHTATGLLTLRTVGGGREPEHALRAAVWRHFSGRRADALLAELHQGMHARHERYGGSVYLLEPNLKQSPGGLRDLAVPLWAAVISFHVTGWRDMLPRGVCSPKAARSLRRARDHLLKVRNALHEAAPYGGDRLTFDRQEAVAEALGHGADRRGVELFMKAYYASASAVKKWSALILERCRERGRPRRPVVSRPVDEHFRVFDGQLTVEDPRLFERSPREAMRLFSVARREAVPIYGYAKERVMDAVAELRADESWRRDPVVARAFLEVLCEPEDPHDALGDLHETGVLAAMLPEFGAVTHYTHHDLYHVYTVDIHTLHAVRRLKALHRGDLADDQPLLTQAMSQIEDPLPLYLGLLMHDAGKALGRGHAVKGARLVPGIGRRLGLSNPRIRLAEWLVRDHLLMAHLSQRRDLSDDALIRQFCRQVGSMEALSMLFVLTWADASTTGPQAYTDWKAALLAELYARGISRFRRGLDLYDDPDRRVARLRRAVTRWLARNGDPRVGDVNSEVDRFFASLPTAYFQKTRARTISRHLELLKRLEESPPVVFEVVPRERRGYTHLHVAGLDRAGLLAAVTGTLAAHHLNVLNAELHVTSEGDALDIFRVREVNGGIPLADPERWDPIEADLRRAVAGEIEVASLIEAAHRTEGRFAWPEGPKVETRANFDQSSSESCTVVDVYTRDRVGLLYSIVRLLDTRDVRITLARITTEGDAVHDTFYLQTREGAKLSDGEARALVRTLNDGLAGTAPPAPRPAVRTG